jgi:hypothetical protein
MRAGGIKAAATGGGMAASCAAPRWLGGGLIALGIANEVDDHRWTITGGRSPRLFMVDMLCLTAVDAKAQST